MALDLHTLTRTPSMGSERFPVFGTGGHQNALLDGYVTFHFLDVVQGALYTNKERGKRSGLA
ncbi:MAG: hypothetical protein ACKPKO_33950, partial [Candidatus Fonsibacter sp.]